MEKARNKIFLIMGIAFIIGLVGGYLVFGSGNKNREAKHDIIVEEKEQSGIDDLNDIYKWVIDANYATLDLLELNEKFNEEVPEETLAKLADFLDVEDYSLIKQQKKAINYIKLPYFNIDSEDGSLANKEINELFERFVNRQVPSWFPDNETYTFDYYDKFFTPWGYYKSDYRINRYKNVLSVVVDYTVAHKHDNSYNYFDGTSRAYNFDLNTGKLLTYEEVYQLLGFSSNDIDEKIKSAIESIYTDDEATLRLVVDHEYYRSLKKMLIHDVRKGVDYSYYMIESKRINISHNREDKSSFFIDENNKLNVVLNLMFPVQDKYYDLIILIE